MSKEHEEKKKKECCHESRHGMGFRKKMFHKMGYKHGLATMSVEDTIKMLEKVKKRLETKLANVNERLEKLKK